MNLLCPFFIFAFSVLRRPKVVMVMMLVVQVVAVMVAVVVTIMKLVVVAQGRNEIRSRWLW